MDLNEILRKASQSQNEVVEIKATVRQLLERVDRQALVIQVLKEMLLAGSAAAEDDFLARLAQAAAQKADDKVCRKCGKPMSPKHSRCMYCGEARPPELV
jgi:ribosomal protein L40E